MNAFSQQEQAIFYGSQEEVEEFDSHDLDNLKRHISNLPAQKNGGNEAIETINLEANDTKIVGLVDRATTHDISAKNVEVEEANNLTMRSSNGRKETLVEKLVYEYHSIDMNTNLGKQATLCTEEAFKRNENLTSINSKFQAAKTCTKVQQSDAVMGGKMNEISFVPFDSKLVDQGSRNYTNIDTCKKSLRKDAHMGGEMKEKSFMPFDSELVDEGSRKYMNINTCERSTRKALKDITNNPLKNTTLNTSENNSESHVSITKGRYERLVKVPLRYKD